LVRPGVIEETKANNRNGSGFTGDSL